MQVLQHVMRSLSFPKNKFLKSLKQYFLPPETILYELKNRNKLLFCCVLDPANQNVELYMVIQKMGNKTKNKKFTETISLH